MTRTRVRMKVVVLMVMTSTLVIVQMDGQETTAKQVVLPKRADNIEYLAA